MEDIIKNMDPQTIQAMIEAGLYNERMTPLKQKFGIGQGMMDAPMAQGRNVQSGPFGTYVASSPFEHIGNMVQKVLGSYLAGNAMQGENDAATARGKGRLAYMKALMSAGQPPAAPDDSGQ